MELAIRALRAVGWDTAGYRLCGGVYVAEAQSGRHRAGVAAASMEEAWQELWALVATILQSDRARG